MSERIPINEARDAQEEWQQEFQNTMRIVGDALGSNGEMLATFSHIRLTRGEDNFTPIPEFKWLSGEVEITCNLEAYEQWVKILGLIPDYEDESKIRQLYLATAATSVELAFLAHSAKDERNIMQNAGVRSKTIRRAAMIINKIEDKEELLKHAEVLEEEYEVSGALEAIMGELSPLRVIELNRLRYGLGTAFFALNLPENEQAEIVNAFRDALRKELELHEETLLIFLDAFAKKWPYDDVAGKFAKAKRYAFPEFLFAGTIPMGYK